MKSQETKNTSPVNDAELLTTTISLLKRMMACHGDLTTIGIRTEYIDFTDSLSTEGQPMFSHKFNRPAFRLAFHWPDLHSIQLHRQYEWKHKNQKFVDEGHPSRLGNRIIGERIYEYLSGEGDAVRR